MKKLIFLTLIVVLAASLILSGCGKTTTTTTSVAPTSVAPTSSAPTSTKPTPSTTTPATGPQSGGILRLIDIEFITGPIGYLPEITFNAVSFMYPCLEGFFEIDIKGSPVPKLATVWEFSPDHKSLTFHLRKDVKFHDGSAFNAAAAKWNMDNTIAAKTSGTEAWDSVEVIDDSTIRINYKAFSSLALANIPNLTKMVSKEAFDKNGIEWARFNPIGTGPFKLKEFKKDVSIEYERFDSYWGGKPYLDGVKFTYVADRTTAELALRGGEADGLHIMGGAHLSANALAPEGFQIILPTCMTPCLFFDTKNPGTQFGDIRVRQAIEYAINKAKICESVGHGYWTPLYESCGLIETGYIPNFKGREYDPAKAKQLLVEAGFPNGFRTKIGVAVHLAGDEETAIQAYLAAVGIDATIELVSASRWVEMMFTGWSEIFVGGVGASEVDSLAPLDRNWGANRFMNPSYAPPAGMQAIIDKMYAEPDYAKRAVLAKEATQLLYDDCTVVPLWSQPALYALSQKIHDNGILDWQLPFVWNWSKVWMSK